MDRPARSRAAPTHGQAHHRPEDSCGPEKGRRVRLHLGTTLSRGELLHLALMSSENRAAPALGRTYPGGRTAFVQRMNAKARRLGMTGSRFGEPTGLALSKTVLSMAIEATGNNPKAAYLCGLRIRTITIAAYAFSALCAGIAGLIAAADIKGADVFTAGLYLELDAILAVVIGGTSLTGGRPRILGSVLGALTMQTLTVTLLMHNVKPEYTLMVKGAAALVVCVAQSPLAARRWPRRNTPKG